MLRFVTILLLLNSCLALSYLTDIKSSTSSSDQKHGKLNIIGGKNTTITKHPYEISITLSSYFVAGAILNKYWVLTTAETLGGSPNGLQVRVGSDTTYSGGKLYPVEKTVYHPSFNPNTYDYDLALHKLKKPLKFGKTVKKIKLPSRELKNKEKTVVSGWGTTPDGGNPFKEINLKALDYNSCVTAYADLGVNILKSQTCAIASYYENGPFYDYGAPLVSKNCLYGMYSFRYISQGVPGVFANVHAGLSWIKKTIKT